MTSAADTARAAAAAGFPDSELVTAVAVAIAESGLNAIATHRNNNGSIDYGLWQINSVHNFTEITSGTWRDPTINAQMAYRVWRAAGWNAWSVHRPSDAVGFARYQLARPVAVAAVAAIGRGGAAAQGAVTTPTDAASGIAGAAGGLASAIPGATLARDAVAALRWAQQPTTWVRVAKVIIGSGMILAAGALLVRGSLEKPVMQAISAIK